MEAGNRPEVHNLIYYRASRIWGKVSIERPAWPEPLWQRKIRVLTIRTRYFVPRKTGGIIPLRSRYGLTSPMPRKSEATAGTRLTGTQSIERALTLLREIAAHNRGGSRLLDLATRTALQRPTVHRMLKCLASENMVQ